MKVKEIMKLSKEQVDDEIFREISCSWAKKDLIRFIIDVLSYKEKRNWIKQWFEGSDQDG